jgi:hypothetical protein
MSKAGAFPSKTRTGLEKHQRHDIKRRTAKTFQNLAENLQKLNKSLQNFSRN